MITLKESFIVALKNNTDSFGVELSEEKCLRLAVFYERVQTWNKRLHLVAPCSAEEFAVRHVLESLSLLRFLPENAGFADVGTGAGLPTIPCLIARPDLHATLIESVAKKTVFLREIVSELNLRPQTLIFNLRFEIMPPPEKGFVTCRALDKFVEQLPAIVDWANDAEKMLFFGGAQLRTALLKQKLEFNEHLIPKSEQRYLFVVSPSNSKYEQNSGA